MGAAIGYTSLDAGWAADAHWFWGFREKNLESMDAMARKLAGAIFLHQAYACLYAKKETNLVGETIYWLHIRAPQSTWERIWRAVGGFGGWIGVAKPEELEAAIAKEQAA